MYVKNTEFMSAVYLTEKWARPLLAVGKCVWKCACVNGVHRHNCIIQF